MEQPCGSPGNCLHFESNQRSTRQVLGADFVVLLLASLQLQVFRDRRAHPPPAATGIDFTLYPRNLLANLKV